MTDGPIIPEIRDMPEQPVRSKRVTMTDFPQSLPKLMGEVLDEIRSAGKMPTGAPVLIYHDQEFNPKEVDVEVAWPVDDASLANDTTPAMKVAYYLHVGPYASLEPVYPAIMEWISANGYRPSGAMREAYINDPGVTPAEQLLTEVIIPVEKV
ncbi:MAG: GyrI-like domain-containing protein [Syntrophomonadales bacterium]|jgi:effector-binding domain-containing protein